MTIIGPILNIQMIINIEPLSHTLHVPGLNVYRLCCIWKSKLVAAFQNMEEGGKERERGREKERQKAREIERASEGERDQ